MSLSAEQFLHIHDQTFSRETPHEWFAVHTRSHFEPRVAAEFTEKGVEHYLPAHTSLHQWKDRRKEVSLPLFPGYLFCRIADTAAARLQVLRTMGVVRILGFGGKITPVSEVQINSIRCLLESGVPWSSYPYLHQGAAVRIKCGPLRGVEGILVRTKSNTRLVLSIELLCQSVSAEVDACEVEVLSSASTECREPLLQTVSRSRLRAPGAGPVALRNSLL